MALWLRQNSCSVRVPGNDCDLRSFAELASSAIKYNYWYSPGICDIVVRMTVVSRLLRIDFEETQLFHE